MAAGNGASKARKVYLCSLQFLPVSPWLAAALKEVDLNKIVFVRRLISYLVMATNWAHDRSHQSDWSLTYVK